MTILDVGDKIEWILDFLLIIITLIYLILYRRKPNSPITIKEIINYNLCALYILISLIHFILTCFTLSNDPMTLVMIALGGTYLLECLLISVYCFYTYMFYICVKNSEHYVLIICIISWIVGLSTFAIYLLIIFNSITNQEIVKGIIIGTALIDLSLPIMLIIIYIILWRNYTQAETNNEEEKASKDKGKKKMLIMGICFIVSVFLNISIIISYNLFTFVDLKMEKEFVREMSSKIVLIRDYILFFFNSIMHISYLLLLVYDEEIYQTLLCKNKRDTQNSGINMSLQELFI